MGYFIKKIAKIAECLGLHPLPIAVGDRMFLEIQDFDFAQI